jgi:hypothetical protein
MVTLPLTRNVLWVGHTIYRLADSMISAMKVVLMCADNQSKILLVVKPGIFRYQAVSEKFHIVELSFQITVSSLISLSPVSGSNFHKGK